MADTSPEAAPLRRRAALVLSKWVPRAGDADRPAAYAALLQLLGSDDAAVQLAAINALQVLICSKRPVMLGTIVDLSVVTS
jgi:hypothetical protein